MTTLAEIRAAAKAKLALQNPDVPVVERVEEPKVQVPQAEVKAEVPPAAGKPLSFQERMALKKAGLPTPDSVDANTESPASNISITDAVFAPEMGAPHTSPITVEGKSNLSVLKTVTDLIAPVYKAAINQEDLDREEVASAEPKVREAYADIKSRINALAPLGEIDLSVAMTELKIAVLQNPSACLLLYEEDLGVMSASLRRLVHEDMIATAKVPKEAKPKKVGKTAILQIPITQEMLDKKFSDL